MNGTAPPKNAVIYLRVSTDKQVKKDYDPEGLSLPAQREACTNKAASLEARVVQEYVEPGVSGGSLRKRKSFQKMLRDIADRGDIDYVIVWSVSRWARDQEDHWTSRGLIRKHGARLISVKEQIGGDSSSEIMVEGVLAAVAAGRRMEIAEDVKRGMARKAQVGGTPYRAPLGYVNVSKVIDGREVRDIELDPDRAELIRECFRLYATGEYSLITLAAIMEARGLRTRATKSAPSKALPPSRLSGMLRNDYYLGLVRVEGKVYPGRHEPLVDEETFETVQSVLASRRQNGARAWKHHHYLAGTLYCAACGGRLLYSRNTGSNGSSYEYFVCINKPLGDCSEPYHRLDYLEAAIDDVYRTIEISDKVRRSIRDGMTARLDDLAGKSSSEVEAAARTLQELKRQEQKLFEAYLGDSISKDLHDEHQSRIRRERVAAETVLRRLDADFEVGRKNLQLILSLVTDTQDAYRRSAPDGKALLNRSLFEAIYIDQDDDVTTADLREPFDSLITLAQLEEAPPQGRQTVLEAAFAATRAGNGKTPARFSRTGVPKSERRYPQGESNPRYQRERLAC